jgi:hypothetical protein
VTSVEGGHGDEENTNRRGKKPRRKSREKKNKWTIKGMKKMLEKVTKREQHAKSVSGEIAKRRI